MKKLVALLFVAVLGATAYGQDFEKGGSYITIGYGVDVNGLPGSSAYRTFGIGPIMASYEYGITDIIGIGRIGVQGGIAFSHYNYDDYIGIWYPYTVDYIKSANRFTVFAKAPYHFEFDVDGLDVYAGAGFGINFDSEKYDYWSNGTVVEGKRSSANFVHYIFAGARWYFSDSFGVYLEVGDGIANINGGVVFAL